MGKYIRKSRGKYIRSVVAAQSRKNKKHKNKKSSKSKNEHGKSEMVYINPIDKITSQKQIFSNKDTKLTEQGNTRTGPNPRAAITIKMPEQYNEMSGQYNQMPQQYSDHHHIIEEFGQCPPDSRDLLLLSGNNDDDDDDYHQHHLDELAEHYPAEPDRRTLIMTKNIRKPQCAPDHASKPASGNGDALSRSNSASCIDMPIPHEGLVAIDKQSITFERTSDIDTMLLFDRVDPTTTYHAEAASSSGEERTHETLILEMNNHSTAPLSQVHYSSYTSNFDGRKIGSMQKWASSSCSSSSIRARALLEIEIEEFFFEAEQRERERFIEKYNFDPLHDIPLPGRYEWLPISSLSPD